jgi:hypothetical protein
MPTALSLPTAETTAVFRSLVSIIKNDPIVRPRIKTFLAWEGTPRDAVTPALGMAPFLRLTPAGGGDQWLSPSSMVMPLIVNMEMLIEGYNTDDPMNLWRAVIASIYAPTQTTFTANQALLRAAGAYPPSPMFTIPAFDARPEDNSLWATPQIRVMVQAQLGSRGYAAASS